MTHYATGRARDEDSSGSVSASEVLERVFVVLGFIFFSGAVVQVIYNPGGMSEVSTGGDPWSTRLQYLFYGGAALLVLSKRDQLLPGFFRARALWALVFLALASTLWSSAPIISLKSAIWLSAATGFGVYFAQRFDENQQVDLLAISIAAMLVVSLLFVALIPDLGVEPGEALGSWRGAFTRKNGLGRAMALGTLILALCARRRRLGRPTFIVLALGCAGTMWFAQSATAVVAAVVTLGAVSLFPMIRGARLSTGRLVALILVASAIAVTLAWQFREPLLGSVGRDTRLTGRDTLWLAVGAKALLHPWLGYGHQAFWRSPEGDYLDVWQIVGWSPPHAHNGFLDVAIELGAIGVLVLMVTLASGFWGGIKRLRYREVGRDGFWPLAYLLFFFLINLSETSTLRHSNIYWILFATALSNALRPTPAPESTEIPLGIEKLGMRASEA